MDDGRALAHRFFGIEDRGQHLVVDFDLAASLFRRTFGFRDDRRDSLPDKTHYVVEQVSIVGIDVIVVVRGGRVQHPRHVLPGIDAADARNGEGGILANRLDARVSVRRPEQFQMQHALDRGVERVPDLAGDDRFRCRRQQSCAARFAGLIFLDRRDAVDRILDRVITGASAEIALEIARQVLDLFFVQSRCGHDHAGRAETALETRRLHERVLHRMQIAVLREAFDGRDLVTVSAKGGNETAMNRDSVEPHRACAAIAGVATFLDPEPSHVAQESSQALSWPRLFRERLAVDEVTHGCTLFESSRRISSAK